MPWWVPSFDNTMVGGLLTFLCIIIGWIVRAMLPSWKAQQDAKAKKIEKEAELADSLKVSSEKQTDLMARQVAQIHDHGIKLDNHGNMLVRVGETLDEHGELLKEIRRQRDRDRDRDPEGGDQKGRTA